MSAHYEVHGKTFKVKEVIKAFGFQWNGLVWTRTEGVQDYLGRSAEESALGLLKVIEEGDNGWMGIEIVYVSADGKEAPL